MANKQAPAIGAFLPLMWRVARHCGWQWLSKLRMKKLTTGCVMIVWRWLWPLGDGLPETPRSLGANQFDEPNYLHQASVKAANILLRRRGESMKAALIGVAFAAIVPPFILMLLAKARLASRFEPFHGPPKRSYSPTACPGGATHWVK